MKGREKNAVQGAWRRSGCWAGPHPSHGSLALTTQEAASSAGSAWWFWPLLGSEHHHLMWRSQKTWMPGSEIALPKCHSKDVDQGDWLSWGNLNMAAWIKKQRTCGTVQKKREKQKHKIPHAVLCGPKNKTAVTKNWSICKFKIFLKHIRELRW